MSLGFFSRAYDRLLRGALRLRWLTILFAAAIFALALGGVRLLDTELIPAISEGEFFFEATMPEGTPVAATDRVIRRMEEAAAAEPGVATYYSTAGSRLVSGGMTLNTKAEHFGQLNVVLADRRDEAAEEALVQRMRQSFATIPELLAKHGKPTYFSLKTPVEVILFSEDLRAAGDLRRPAGGGPGTGARPGGPPLVAGGGEPRAADHLRP